MIVINDDHPPWPQTCLCTHTPQQALFQKVLGVETTTFAFGLPTDKLHAPDEHYRLDSFWLARAAWVHLLADLGAATAAAGSSAEAEGPQYPDAGAARVEL